MNLEYYWSKFMKLIRARGITNSRIDKTATIYPGSSVVDSSMGKHSYCGLDCWILSVDIGNFCSISDEVFIEGNSGHAMHHVSTSAVFFSQKSVLRKKFATHICEMPKRTTIGHDVWIGKRALIKAGVTIGNGAAIGMGSVVTKDVPPYTVVAGNPAKPIRKRFDDKQIQLLQESEWWTLPDREIQGLAPIFNEVDTFLKNIH